MTNGRVVVVLVLTGALLAVVSGSDGAEGQPKTAAALERQPPQKKRQRVVSNLTGFELLDAARLSDKPVVAGATREVGTSEPPAILAPHLAKLHGVRPVFAWRHAADRFAFVLSDELGQDVFVAEVTGHSYAWPATAPRLADGQTYLWSVRPAGGPSTELASMAAVVVVTSQERQTLDQALAAVTPGDPYGEGLARAEVLVERRVWYDALGALTDLIARFPDRPEAYELRGLLFAQIPATQTEAAADFGRADTLTGAQ